MPLRVCPLPDAVGMTGCFYGFLATVQGYEVTSVLEQRVPMPYTPFDGGRVGGTQESAE